MPRKARDPYAGLPEMDPRGGGDLYFDIHYEDYNVDEDANDPESSLHALATELKAEEKRAGYPRTYFKLEREAERNAATMLGKSSVSTYGHDDYGNVDARVSVDNYSDLERMIDSIQRADRTADYAGIGLGDSPYHEARGFKFFPRGVNGPRYDIGEIADMIAVRKPKRTSKRRHSR